MGGYVVCVCVCVEGMFLSLKGTRRVCGRRERQPSTTYSRAHSLPGQNYIMGSLRAGLEPRDQLDQVRGVGTAQHLEAVRRCTNLLHRHRDGDDLERALKPTQRAEF